MAGSVSASESMHLGLYCRPNSKYKELGTGVGGEAEVQEIRLGREEQRSELRKLTLTLLKM